jgi:hypothetical protein
MKNTLTVKETVVSVLTEICEAVESVRNEKPYVAPKAIGSKSNPSAATSVDFDLAITVTENASVENNKQAALTIGIARFNVNAEASKEKNNQSTVFTESRVKFSVPVYFQHDETKTQNIDYRNIYNK